MTKLVERVAINRMKHNMAQPGWKLYTSMMGGITGKGVDVAAHNLGVLLGKSRRYGKRVCGMSVDIRKAFDRIGRDVLWDNSLHRMLGCQSIAWFKRLYENHSGRVKVGGYVSE